MKLPYRPQKGLSLKKEKMGNARKAIVKTVGVLRYTLTVLNTKESLRVAEGAGRALIHIQTAVITLESGLII